MRALERRVGGSMNGRSTSALSCMVLLLGCRRRLALLARRFPRIRLVDNGPDDGRDVASGRTSRSVATPQQAGRANRRRALQGNHMDVFMSNCMLGDDRRDIGH